jgi:hypothetical protein
MVCVLHVLVCVVCPWSGGASTTAHQWTRTNSCNKRNDPLRTDGVFVVRILDCRLLCLCVCV